MIRGNHFNADSSSALPQSSPKHLEIIVLIIIFQWKLWVYSAFIMLITWMNWLLFSSETEYSSNNFNDNRSDRDTLLLILLRLSLFWKEWRWVISLIFSYIVAHLARSHSSFSISDASINDNCGLPSLSLVQFVFKLISMHRPFPWYYVLVAITCIVWSGFSLTAAIWIDVS